jgi:hypothetical protein
MSVPGSLRLGAGMVGGGPGAMIGEAHRTTPPTSKAGRFPSGRTDGARPLSGIRHAGSCGTNRLASHAGESGSMGLCAGC